MKNIFISGSNGYIGQNLLLFLSKYFKVYGISRDLKIFSYCGDLGLSKKVIRPEQINFDINDSFLINAASIESKNSKVLDFYHVNLMHSLRLLEFCSNNNIPYFIIEIMYDVSFDSDRPSAPSFLPHLRTFHTFVPSAPRFLPTAAYASFFPFPRAGFGAALNSMA